MNKSNRLIRTIEFITIICSKIMGEILSSKRRFERDKNEAEFEELMQLYTTNVSIYRDFAIFLIDTYIFPSSVHSEEL